MRRQQSLQPHNADRLSARNTMTEARDARRDLEDVWARTSGRELPVRVVSLKELAQRAGGLARNLKRDLRIGILFVDHST